MSRGSESTFEMGISCRGFRVGLQTVHNAGWKMLRGSTGAQGMQQKHLCLHQSSGTGGTRGDFPHFYKERGVGEPGSGLQRDFGPSGDFPLYRKAK